MMKNIIKVLLVATIIMYSVIAVVLINNEIVDYIQYQQVLKAKEAIIAL